MSLNDLQQKRDEIAYIKDIKELIIADARAFYSTRGLVSCKGTFDVTTAIYGGGHQAILIYYPDLSDNTCWNLLFEGVRSKTLTDAMKHLWNGIQESIGAMIAAQKSAVMSPTMTVMSTTAASAEAKGTEVESPPESPESKKE